MGKSEKKWFIEKKLKKTTFILIFGMKIYPYISEAEKPEFINNMNKYVNNISKDNKSYITFFN